VVDVAALRMAEDDGRGAGIAEHPGAHVAGEGGVG
jgi:hypothetical protein